MTLVHDKIFKHLFISYLNVGLCPKPHFIFWLEPKNEAKKFKAVPASHEKLALDRLNRPNSLVPRSNKDDS